MPFEETVQYTNSLAWMYSIDDHLKKIGSGKHRLLKFLWWNERYLKLTRENYPDEHEHWMKYYAEPFLNVWGRSGTIWTPRRCDIWLANMTIYWN